MCVSVFLVSCVMSPVEKSHASCCNGDQCFLPHDSLLFSVQRLNEPLLGLSIFIVIKRLGMESRWASVP